MKRRNFLKTSVGSTAAVTIFSGLSVGSSSTEKWKKTPMDDLKSMTMDIIPISVDERKGRIEKAQRLMAENKIDALYLDGGTSMEYFTGIRWGNSERMMSAIIPAKGDVKY